MCVGNRTVPIVYIYTQGNSFTGKITKKKACGAAGENGPPTGWRGADVDDVVGQIFEQRRARFVAVGPFSLSLFATPINTQ